MLHANSPSIKEMSTTFSKESAMSLYYVLRYGKRAVIAYVNSKGSD